MNNCPHFPLLQLLSSKAEGSAGFILSSPATVPCEESGSVEEEVDVLAALAAIAAEEGRLAGLGDCCCLCYDPMPPDSHAFFSTSRGSCTHQSSFCLACMRCEYTEAHLFPLNDYCYHRCHTLSLMSFYVSSLHGDQYPTGYDQSRLSQIQPRWLHPQIQRGGHP